MRRPVGQLLSCFSFVSHVGHWGAEGRRAVLNLAGFTAAVALCAAILGTEGPPAGPNLQVKGDYMSFAFASCALGGGKRPFRMSVPVSPGR